MDIFNLSIMEMIYWVIALITIFIGLVTTAQSKPLNWTPLAWSGTLGILLVCFNQYITPIFTGYETYGASLLGYACLLLTGMIIFVIAQCNYNMVVYGEVSQ